MENPDRLDTFNTFMEASRGSRSSWLEWFPVKEQVINWFDVSTRDVLLVDLAGGRGRDIEEFHQASQIHIVASSWRNCLMSLKDISHMSSATERIEFDLLKSNLSKG